MHNVMSVVQPEISKKKTIQDFNADMKLKSKFTELHDSGNENVCEGKKSDDFSTNTVFCLDFVFRLDSSCKDGGSFSAFLIKHTSIRESKGNMKVRETSFVS